MPTCVKICGLRSPKDAQAAAAAGADAIGLVFYQGSPRHVSAAQAAAVVRALPPFVTVVGVFVDPDARQLDEVLSRVPLDLIQFHGNETAAACSAHGRRYLKGLRVAPGTDLAALAAPYSTAAGLLLDTWVAGVPGGTGQQLALDRLPPLPRPVVLAGGLNAGNVGPLVRRLRPYGVDVSSGVESRPGVKDAARMRDFVAAVRQADQDAGGP